MRATRKATMTLIAGIAAAGAVVGLTLPANAAHKAHEAPSGPATAQTATATYHAKSGTAPAWAGGTTFDWGYRQGWWIFNLSGLPVAPGQPVSVSATEVDANGNEFIGAAHVHCENVSVRQNVVSTLCLFDWGSPIHVRLHYVY